jgi:hypothetical protein
MSCVQRRAFRNKENSMQIHIHSFFPLICCLIGVVSVAPASAQSLQIIPRSPFTGPLQVKPGYSSPQGDYRPFDTSADVAFEGGLAQAAVAKDVIPDYDAIHLPEYANDGYYGNGASWISNSPDSWLKIDLGEAAPINSVIFGRDRLGGYDDRDPGQFTVAVALSDDVYANGNDSNDTTEYTQVFDSTPLSFDGNIVGAQTLRAVFATSVSARYVKLTFANFGTAIDEVEIRVVPAPGALATVLLGAAPGVGLLLRRRWKTS